MSGNDNKKGLSRRGLMGALTAAGAALPLMAQAQTPAAPAGAPAGGRGGRGQRVTPGGTGPIKVLFVSKFHPFDRENLFLAFDSMGKDITWTHVEQPAAEVFYDPANAAPYDVLMFYDAFAGRVTKQNPDGSVTSEDTVPSAKTQANLKKLLQNGDKGFLFFHHALASWAHTWPAGLNGSNAYAEVMGGAADWGKGMHIRGVDYPPSGAQGRSPQHITIVDRNHPITQGVEDFDITDEAYLCPIFEDSVHPLMRTNFKPVVESFTGRPQMAGHPPGSNLTGWVKVAERSPVAYIQHGHDNTAWTNPAWLKLMLNAIKWCASPESKTWAHANPKRIFK